MKKVLFIMVLVTLLVSCNSKSKSKELKDDSPIAKMLVLDLNTGEFEKVEYPSEFNLVWLEGDTVVKKTIYNKEVRGYWYKFNKNRNYDDYYNDSTVILNDIYIIQKKLR